MHNQSNILNNLTFMYKVKSETALAGFPTSSPGDEVTVFLQKF